MWVLFCPGDIVAPVLQLRLPPGSPSTVGLEQKFLIIVLSMEGPNELRDIKKEIIEARGLIIKSNNLANSLSAEMRSIAKRQASYERQISLNSIVTYVIVAVIAWAGVQLAYNYRQSSLEESLEMARKEAASAKAELAALKKASAETGSTKGEDLLEIWNLISEGERQDAIDAFEALNLDALTPLEKKLLSQAIERFRGDLSMQHYSKGLELIDEQKFAEAVEELRTSLRFKEDAAHAKAAKIQLANALRLQGKPREAIAVLQRLIEEHLDRDLSDDAYWYLALSHQEAHQKDEARSVLRALMRQFPDSQYYRAARIKAADIQIHLYSSGD